MKLFGTKYQKKLYNLVSECDIESMKMNNEIMYYNNIIIIIMQPCNVTNIKSNQFKNEFQIENCMSIAIQNWILEIINSKLSSTLKKKSHIIFKEVKNQNQNQSQNQNLSENCTGNFIKNV